MLPSLMNEFLGEKFMNLGEAWSCYDLSSPFRVKSHVYATDGKIVARCPVWAACEVEQRENVPANMESLVEGWMERTVWIPATVGRHWNGKRVCVRCGGVSVHACSWCQGTRFIRSHLAVEVSDGDRKAFIPEYVADLVVQAGGQFFLSNTVSYENPVTFLIDRPFMYGFAMPINPGVAGLATLA